MTPPDKPEFPVTPDGRHFVVRVPLWQRANPSLDETRRAAWVSQLMTARRAVDAAKNCDDRDGVARARQAVDLAKRALGERGPVWWADGAPDLNRRMVHNTAYAGWYATVQESKT